MLKVKQHVSSINLDHLGYLFKVRVMFLLLCDIRFINSNPI